MARVTTATVDHIAALARLSLSPEERETFARQLGQILEYAESIQSLEAAPQADTARAMPLREDEPRPVLDARTALAAAPDAADGLFRVPRVIG